MIELENVTKAYPLGRETVTALDRVSLTVGAGEYAAIIGPSGSGKSTLMHILGCLDRPTSGTYRLHGRDVSTLSAEELAHVRGEEIGFVFQGFQLLPQLTAVENVALPLLLSGVNRRQRLQRAETLLGEVGLGARIRHRPSQLSGGQQQRVAIARALAAGSELILADEPTGNLDEENSRNIFAILRELAHERERCVIAVTHDMELAQRTDRILRIQDGRIAEEG